MKSNPLSASHIEKTLGRLQSQLESKREYQADFVKKFQEDPAQALSWSKDIFMHTAKAKVLEGIIADLEIYKTLPEAEQIKTGEHWRRASVRHSCPQFSTSPTSNLLDAFIGQAWMEVLTDLGIL